MQTFTEENYLKTIYHLATESETVSTNQLAAILNTKAASVTDMLKRLAEKQLIDYKPYYGVSLTPTGSKIAVNVIRRHRLWEYFLVEKLKFKWDEVHEMAEELEHISSIELVDRLDEFMGHPSYDPHGDPIPDKNGHFKHEVCKPISMLAVNEGGPITAVREHTSAFLQYLEKLNLLIGNKVKVVEVLEYDQSVVLTINESGNRISISRDAAKNILIAI
ncbi:metal-dependent transcriptional regulator [Mucilaginibacter sp. KACC 22063]|uniref:metal-dependent transcriptional regulator n=1 Tax=Mucilaginibacter sp. KACC 22063 TaxID=3025666 RepID=UPI0023664C8C|nr:metal-dependent transcriptional regulator [Mucilaginibacter sp. KACC 22063]WDF54147.1 metal-dependent transcriptional regulator [Mucilaginibacter sp. KACC 22063]